MQIIERDHELRMEKQEKEVGHRDVGLLGDEDDDIVWSPPPIDETKFNLDASTVDSSRTFKSISSGSDPGQFSIGKIKVERPKPVQKMVISPNRPNASSATKAELKSIDRPRSHSPLKLTGIEEYVQQFEKNPNVVSNQVWVKFGVLVGN